jgi:cell volume regulation protein A
MYLIAALILLAIILVARISNKWRVPLVVISLLAGILFGREGLGLVQFKDFVMARQIADFALVFILFIGGFDTQAERLRLVLGPAMILATIGVIMTAAITGASLHLLLQIGLPTAVLIGCIIASTDAAAVFSILRSREIDKKLSSVVEIESATNDPMAIVLTSIAVQLIVSQLEHPARIGLSLVWLIVGGIGVGLIVGKLGVFLFRFIRYLDKGYLYVYMIAIIMLSFGVADLCHASGILSAFFAGFFMGNSNIPYKSNISTMLDAISTIANVIIFVLLGFLVSLKEIASVYLGGIFLFLVLAFIARPITVLCCTFFTRYTFKEKIFINWSGLRGAVPMVLATYPAAAGVSDSSKIFHIIFFAVFLSMMVQGTTITKLADLLKLGVKAKPKPRQVMELITLQKPELELVEIVIDEDVYSGKVLISDLDLPGGTTITMVNRRDAIIAPRGNTALKAGDVLYVLCKPSNIENVNSEIMKKFQMKHEIT